MQQSDELPWDLYRQGLQAHHVKVPFVLGLQKWPEHLIAMLQFLCHAGCCLARRREVGRLVLRSVRCCWIIQADLDVRLQSQSALAYAIASPSTLQGTFAQTPGNQQSCAQGIRSKSHPLVTVCMEKAIPHRVIIGLPDRVRAFAAAAAQCWPVICLMLAVGHLGQIGQQAALTRLAPALLRMLLALCRLGLLCGCLSLFVLQTSCLRCALLP